MDATLFDGWRKGNEIAVGCDESGPYHLLVAPRAVPPPSVFPAACAACLGTEDLRPMPPLIGLRRWGTATEHRKIARFFVPEGPQICPACEGASPIELDLMVEDVIGAKPPEWSWAHGVPNDDPFAVSERYHALLVFTNRGYGQMVRAAWLQLRVAAQDVADGGEMLDRAGVLGFV